MCRFAHYIHASVWGKCNASTCMGMQNEIHMNDHATHMNARVTKIQINQCVMSQIPSFSRYECVCV